jgi:hypothetical protein
MSYLPRSPWKAGACSPAFRAKQELSHYIVSDDPQEDSDAIGFTSPHAHGEDSAAAVAQLWAAAPELLAAMHDVLRSCAGEPANDAARKAKYAALYRATAAVRKAEGRDA